MRVVLDTNVWVSGLLWRELPWRLLGLAEAGQIEICVAATALNELAHVLSYERLQPRIRQLGLEPAEIVAYAAGLATVFDVPMGEHHLLDLGEYAGIPIVTVRDFLAREFPTANS